MPRKTSEEAHVKRMANLLRQGSTLTELACPACASPLFRLRNRDLWCAKCEKKVLLVKEGEDPTILQSSLALGDLEMTLLTKIQETQDKMKREENVDELQKLGALLSGLLENLEKVRKVKRT